MNDITVDMRTSPPADGLVAETVNLRSHGKGILSATGNPSAIARMQENDRFVGCDHRNGSTYYFVLRNGNLVLLGRSEADGTFTEDGTVVAQLEEDIGKCAATGDFFILSTDAGLRFLHYSGGTYTFLGGAPQFPVLAFGTTDTAQLTATLPGHKLNGAYPEWSGTLQASDASAVTRQVKTAFDNLRQQAEEGMRCIFPVMLRTALRLWDGSLLWSPETAMAGNGYSLPETLAPVTMIAAGEYRVENTSVSLTAWKPSVTLISPGIGAWRHLVKAVEIYAAGSQDLLPDTVEFRCEKSQQGGPEYCLRMKAASVKTLQASRSLPHQQEFRLIASISDIESLFNGKIAAQGVSPVTDGTGGCLSASTFAIGFTGGGEKAAFQPTVPAFSASALTTVGDRCFAGNVTTKLPEPPRYESICNPSGFVEETASVTVAVEIAGQSSHMVVARSAATNVWSQKLNGFIAYPDSRALHMTVVVMAGGKKYAFETPLCRNGSGNMAYAEADDEGFTLQPSDKDFSFASTATTEHQPCTLLASAPGNPLQWQTCGKAGNRGIAAVAPAFGLGSSWQLGRHSVCLFAVEGVYLLSFDTKDNCSGTTLISRLTTDGNNSVTATSEGLAFIAADGGICRIKGTKATRTGITVRNAKSIGYSMHFDEIWIEDSEGFTIVENEGNYYRRDLKASIAATQEHTLLIGNGTILTPEKETEESIRISMLTPAVVMPCTMRASAVIWDITGDNLDIRLAVYGDNGRSCCGSLIAALEVKGSPGSPLFHRIAAPFVRTVRLSASGTLPPRTLLYPARIICDNGIS